MKGLLSHLNLHLEGNHHSDEDDVSNLVRAVIKMIQIGIKFDITGSHNKMSCKPDYDAVIKDIQNYPGTRKTETSTCIFFQKGHCRYGDKCRFSHVILNK